MSFIIWNNRNWAIVRMGLGLQIQDYNGMGFI
jgi:hypothetical protein